MGASYGSVPTGPTLLWPRANKPKQAWELMIGLSRRRLDAGLDAGLVFPLPLPPLRLGKKGTIGGLLPHIVEHEAVLSQILLLPLLVPGEGGERNERFSGKYSETTSTENAFHATQRIESTSLVDLGDVWIRRRFFRGALFPYGACGFTSWVAQPWPSTSRLPTSRN